MNTLRTARLTLEPQRAAHADEMFHVLSDPALYEFENEPPPSPAWLRERFERLETRCSADGLEQWLNWVIRGPSGELVGYVQATVPPDLRALIAYELSSRFWGHGFAQEAVLAMLAELELHYRVRQLSAVLKRGNLRSMRLLERLGFTPGSAAQHAELHVEPDEVLMCRPIRGQPVERE